MSYISKNPEAKAEYEITRQQFLRLLPYQLVMVAVGSLNGIVNSIVASNMIGNDAMSAIGMFAPLNHLIYAISITMVSGSQILYGRYIARNQEQELNNVFSVNQIFALIISLLLSLILVIGVQMDASKLFVSTEEEINAFNAYFLGMAIGIPGLIMGQQLFAFISLENRSGWTLAASLVCAVSNVGLDLLFVGGLGMGSFGLALATSLSSWAFFFVLASYFFLKKSFIRFSGKGLRVREFGPMVRLGYPGSVSRFAEMIRSFIVNALILSYVGTVGLSSFAASNSLLAVFWSLPFGMMAVTRMLLSISVGAEDRKGTIINMYTSLRWGVLIQVIVSALIIALAVPFTRIFFQDPTEPVFQMTVMAFRLLPICMPLSVISLTFLCYYQTMEKKVFATILPIMDGLVYVALFSLILMPHMGMNGLYLANILNGAGCCLLIVLFAVFALKRLPRNLDDLLAMPKDFGCSEENSLEFTVNTVEDVVSVSRRVEEFCLDRGVDKRRSMFAGLALEEMAGNVVEHGFEKDNKQHTVDIRVSIKDEDVILQVTDNCIPFNPGDRVKIEQPADGVSNLGIKKVLSEAKSTKYLVGIPLAYNISKDVNYKNILGLNVLTITL